MEIKNKFNGFLNDAVYSYPAQEVISEYKYSFGSAEVLVVNLNEIMADFALNSKVEGVDISDDGKCITITIEKFKNKDGRGKFTVLPNPGLVIEALKRKLEKAVELYKVKFPVDIIEKPDDKNIQNTDVNSDDNKENTDDNNG